MKYPIQQFEVLVSGLHQLAEVVNVQSIHPAQLHYIVYQQGSEGQTHNWLYRKGTEVRRAHSIEDLSGWEKVVTVIPADFQLYPEGCNDDHIQTAVKKALKVVG
jgi:hypothetical protein